MLAARVQRAPFAWKASCAFIIRARAATKLLHSICSKMYSGTSAFTCSSAVSPRGGFVIGSWRKKCHSAMCYPRDASGCWFSLRPAITRTLRCAVTDTQRAYIFQRSPYHDYRVRQYAVLSSQETDASEASKEVADLRKSDTGSYVDSTLKAGVSATEETISEVKETESSSLTSLDDEYVVAVGIEDSVPLSDVSLGRTLATGEQRETHESNLTEESAAVRKEVRVEQKSIATKQSMASSSKVEPRGDTVVAGLGRTFSSHDQLLDAFYAISGDPLEKDGGRIVVYRGNPKARLMIIGEAPGEQEDIEGKPFVGKAGQLLDKIFQYGGFDMEEQVYVTNIGKRRPANNRTPTLEEVEYYLPYLLEEIRLINPAIIVLAGSVATKALLGPDIRITKVRGQWFRLGQSGPPMMPVFHPAYMLRKPIAKYDMVTDIEEIRAKYIELVPEDELKPLKAVS